MLSISTCQSSYHLLPLTVTPSRLPVYYHVSSNPFYFKEFETTSDPFPPALSISQLHITQAEKRWPVIRLCLHYVSKTDASLLQVGRKWASLDAEATWLYDQHNAELDAISLTEKQNILAELQSVQSTGKASLHLSAICQAAPHCAWIA